MAQPALSIIVPVWNDAKALEQLLKHFSASPDVEMIVVDGGGSAEVRELCLGVNATYLKADRGRASQQIAGVKQAAGAAFWFLHADCVPPPNSVDLVLRALTAKQWGRFDVRLDGNAYMLVVVAFFMNWRSGITHVCTGDQGLFMRRSTYAAVGGFSQIPLMEDIVLSKKLKRLSAPARVRQRLTTSGRRWEAQGVWSTIWLMWRLRWRFWRGADPAELHRIYYR
jgi:rSAM/selenodomain-associated transferase 2